MKPDVTYKNVFTTPSLVGEGLSKLLRGRLNINRTAVRLYDYMLTKLSVTELEALKKNTE
jgi:hypothetical protein